MGFGMFGSPKASISLALSTPPRRRRYNDLSSPLSAALQGVSLKEADKISLPVSARSALLDKEEKEEKEETLLCSYRKPYVTRYNRKTRPVRKDGPDEDYITSGKGGGFSVLSRGSSTVRLVMLATQGENEPETKELRAKLREDKRTNYRSPDQVRVTKISPTNTPLMLATLSPEPRTLVLTARTFITDKESPKNLNYSFYQTLTSACGVLDTPEIPVAPEKSKKKKLKKKKIKKTSKKQTAQKNLQMQRRLEKISRPLCGVYKAECIVGPKKLAAAKRMRRQYSHNVPATELANKHGEPGSHEHSHMVAKSQGQTLAKAINGKDEFHSMPANTHGNTDRAFGPEGGMVAHLREKDFEHENKIELVKDKGGLFKPVIDREKVVWRNISGNHKQREAGFLVRHREKLANGLKGVPPRQLYYASCHFFDVAFGPTKATKKKRENALMKAREKNMPRKS